MIGRLHRFMEEDSGASAIEYGLIIGVIAVILIAVLILFGGGTQDLFAASCAKIPGCS